MTLTILDVDQRSDEWHAARRGIITASVMDKLITVRKLGAIDYACPACQAPALAPCRSKVKKAGEVGADIKTLHPERTPAPADKTTVIEPANSEESRRLTMSLAIERVSNYTEQTFVSTDMLNGIYDEPVARDFYSLYHAPVTEAGFMIREDLGLRVGYSPDGLVGDDGLIEVKSRRQRKQMETVLRDGVPLECMAQLQTGLFVTERAWIDYVSFSSGLAFWVKRVYPDPRWQTAIAAAARQFEVNASAMVAEYLELTRGLPMTERIEHFDDVVVV